MIYISSSCIKAKTIKESVTILAEVGFNNIELSGGTQYYSSFETDFTGIVTEGILTASKHFSNQKFLQLNDCVPLKPLGTTSELKPTGSISFKGGRFFDETFVYPANHQFVVGTSKDGLDSLIYAGTQNIGGEAIESEAFIDLSPDPSIVKISNFL